ncbi:hypothetical protein [Mucilaginibacter segetis]|uniref:Uncharacterized protein n=1 Tax=Mucilaginibacter segetis TaxID=2793071 RepID=A0A934PUY0_9SPHI|nr:hypothetical protein [Mucilaginibacter segetis]MBK0380067.1 hypothetical protein [Mucilaginibacter segetis]
MKNFKQLALGLMVGALAISFSAFTNANNNTFVKHHRAVKAGMITDDYIVQPTLNNFQENASPTSSNCHGTATLQCIYDVTSSGQTNIPDQASYTASNINSYVAAGYLVADPNSHASLY